MVVGSLFSSIVDFILHIDVYLVSLVQHYGFVTYFILFLIIFVETGIVIAPFLPGDSLLFVAGTLAAQGSFDIFLLFFILSLAAVLGDTANYWIGFKTGKKLDKLNKLIKREHLEQAHNFYEKHGGKAIIFARFAPIIRTFAPFVAGVGKMDYRRFLAFNVLGGLLWVALFVFGGYFFGTIQVVKDNLSLIIIGIIFLSLIPPLIAWTKSKMKR